MDVQKQTEQLISDLKADKSIAQPWKNYAVSDAMRLLAVIEKGKRVTNRTPPPDVAAKAQQSQAGCTCEPGKKASVNCPVHGINL